MGTTTSNRALGIAAVLGFLAWTVPGAALAAPENGPTIHHVAGTGVPGYWGDGGPATLAGVPAPIGIAFDAAGNLYVTDAAGLRRIDASNGVITTVAGAADVATSPLRGWSRMARSLAIDSQGDLYFAGFDIARAEAFSGAPNLPSQLVKYETTTGTKTLVATFPAPTNELGLAIALSADGDVFVSDQGRHRVYRVDLPGGTVTTVAGTGVKGFAGDGGPAVAAQLNGPLGIAFDGNGDLYIADEQNHRVRKVTLSTGVITTYVGDGVASDSGNGGHYSSARVARPCGVMFSPAGHVFVRTSSAIRRIDGVSGVITHHAGVGGGSGAANPPGMTLDGVGRVAFCDTRAHRVVQVDPTTLAETRLAGSAEFNSQHFMVNPYGDGGPGALASLAPYDVVADAAGNVFVSDMFGVSRRVVRIDAATGNLTTVTEAGDDPMFLAMGIDLDPDGRLVIAGAVHVWRVDLSTGVRSLIAGTGSGPNSGDGGPATAAGISGATDVVVLPDGDVLVACQGRVRRIDAATGVISRFAGNGSGHSGDGGPAVDAGVSPDALAVDSFGNVFIADNGNRRIRRVDAATGIITTVGGTGSQTFFEGALATEIGMYPSSIAVDSQGNVFFSERGTPRVRRIDAATGIATTVAGTGAWAPRFPAGDGGSAFAARFALVYQGLSVDAQDRLLVCDTTLRRIDDPSAPGAFLQAPATVVRESNTGNNSASLAFNLTVVGIPHAGMSLVVDDLTGGRNLLSATAASGSYTVSAVFPMGPSDVVAKLVDGVGTVRATVSISVQVQDTLPPVIVGCGNKKVVSPTADPVAISPESLTMAVFDACDPSPTLELSATELPNGFSTVTATAVDATGNSTSCTFEVEVVQTSTTTVETSLPSGVTRSVEITFGGLSGAGATSVTTTDAGPDIPGGYQFGGEFVWYEIHSGATFTGPVTLTFSWNEGEFDPESAISILHYENGEWVDITTSVDTENNRVYASTNSFSPFVMVQTRYAFTGVNQPINTDGSSVFKGSKTIPVKFQLFRPNGAPATTAVARLRLFKVTDAVLGTEEEVTVDAPGNSNGGDLFEHQGGGRYHYSLSTKELSSGHYRGEIALDDGSAHSFEFSLK